MSRRRGAFVALLLAFSLIAAACNDNDAGSRPFCEVQADIARLILFSGAPPDDARETVSELRGLLDELVSAAPDEVRSAVEDSAAASTTLLDLFADAGFDEAAVDQAEVSAAFEDALVASETMLGWVEINCPA